MTREEVKKIVAEAHEIGERANLRGANLSGANLRGADLCWADLRGANLRDTKTNYLTIGIHAAPEGENECSHGMHFFFTRKEAEARE